MSSRGIRVKVVSTPPHKSPYEFSSCKSPQRFSRIPKFYVIDSTKFFFSMLMVPPLFPKTPYFIYCGHTTRPQCGQHWCHVEVFKSQNIHMKCNEQCNLYRLELTDKKNCIDIVFSIANKDQERETNAIFISLVTINIWRSWAHSMVSLHCSFEAKAEGHYATCLQSWDCWLGISLNQDRTPYVSLSKRVSTLYTLLSTGWTQEMDMRVN